MKSGSTGAEVLQGGGRQDEVSVLFDWSKKAYERFWRTRQAMRSWPQLALGSPPEHAVVEPVGEPARSVPSRTGERLGPATGGQHTTLH